MKVLLVSEPGMDGVFRYVEALCHFLIGQNAEVHFAYSDRRKCDRLATLVDFVEAHGGQTINLHVSNKPELNDLAALVKLSRLIGKVRPDIVHSHSSKAGALARLLSRPWGPVHIYQPHAYFGIQPNPGKLSILYNLLEAIFGRLSHTIPISSEEALFARQRLYIPGRRVHPCLNGVDTARFVPPTPLEKSQLREKFGIPQNAIVLGTIGRLSEQKDPVTLYRSFSQAVKSCPDLHFFHVGKGELEPAVEHEIKTNGLSSHVTRLPYWGVPEEIYRALDGFILTSRYEGFSLAALEALSTNLPIILSEAKGNNDLLAWPFSQCWHAPVGDIAGFARAMCDFHQQTKGGDRPNHRQVISQYFELRLIHRRVMKIYGEVSQRALDPTPLQDSFA